MLSTPISVLGGLANSIRPLFRHTRQPHYGSSLGVEQPILKIFVPLSPLSRVFRHPASAGLLIHTADGFASFFLSAVVSDSEKGDVRILIAPKYHEITRREYE
jgi:hypothetical protein